jgi:hypothetical protein
VSQRRRTDADRLVESLDYLRDPLASYPEECPLCHCRDLDEDEEAFHRDAKRCCNCGTLIKNLVLCDDRLRRAGPVAKAILG